ncbi:MAG: dihydroorotase [Candidatus Hadarchaeum sp.]|uniref:dihydroorotase n=1 Tax=Candidatus Hadarchaeum sp. TaxID=2883567 RepID=UPI003D11816A
MVGLVLRNGRIVLPEGIVDGEISVDNGKISKIAVSGLPKGETEIDVRGRTVIPGVVDVHVHFHDKKFLNREDFAGGSTAAAAGGVTTVIVMPWDTPVVSGPSIEETIELGCRMSIVDFSLHAGNMSPESIKKVPEINSFGIKSFKAFTCDPYLMSYEQIEELMCYVRAIGGVTFIHAEDQKTLSKNLRALKKRKDPLAHALSRPAEAEEKAIKKVLKSAERTGCRTHIAHVTTREGCEAIQKAKKRGVHVSAETCPHYLIFKREDMEKLGPYLKVNPSLKSDSDRAALWQALAEGIVDIVSTDHAPASKEEKDRGWIDIWEVPSGVPGVETSLPLMLSEGVSKGRLTLEQLVNCMCTKPAILFGLYPRKGVIQEGSDADLIILDLKEEAQISAERLHYKVGWTPFEGMRVKGIPVMTILRGTIIAEGGKVIGSSGYGQFLPR